MNRPFPDDLLNEDQPNVFHIRTTRHDQDRIEVNIGFDGLVRKQKGFFNFDVDFLLFVPKSLGLNEIDPQEILRNEFQSYFRLHSFTGLYSKTYTASILLKRLHDLDQQLDQQTLQTFAIEFDAYLKAQKRKLYKLARRKPQTILTDTPSHMESLSDLEAIMTSFRALLDKNRVYEKPAGLPKSDLNRELFLLNEYVSHLYIQVLLRLQNFAQQLPNRDSVLARVKEMIRTETNVRKTYDLYVLSVEEHFSEGERQDFYLRRISLLKKYFSKPLFVKFQEKHLEKRMLLPVYGLSAALAAAWAIMVQIYTVQSTLQTVGINTIAFISVGVIAYVIKDLLKDSIRRFFFKSSRRFFPDVENKLFIQEGGAQHLLGSSKAFVRSHTSSELNGTLVAERYQGEIGAIERILGEDVLHFKKRVSLNLARLAGAEQFPWGFREIIRYRFDRLRVSMEDAYKRLPLLSRDGEIVLREARRVYKVNLVVQVRAIGRNVDPAHVKVKAYELSLDKNGLISCAGIPWGVSFTNPIKDPI